MDADATHGTGASFGNRLLEAETHQSADLEAELPECTPRSTDTSKNSTSSNLVPTRNRRASTAVKNDRDRNTMDALLRLLELKRFTDSFPQNSKVSEILFAFHHHCGPLILENRIIGPDSWHSASSERDTKKKAKETKPKQHKYTGPDDPHLFEADGIYKGEIKNGKPNGWGLWVSFSSFEQHFDENTHRKGFQDPISVTILWGNWKCLQEDDMELTEGSMLHAYVPDMDGAFWPFRRCVGFSYKGRLSLDTLKNPKKFKANNLFFELKFDCNDPNNHATFREFEFAAIKMALPKSTQGDPEFPLQIWVELFYDSLLDDGLERKGCRNYGEHRKIFEQTPKELDFALPSPANATAEAAAAAKSAVDTAVNEGFIEFLTSNYIGGGLQYFVPRIVNGTFAHFETLVIVFHSYCHKTTLTQLPFLCHVCKLHNYSQIEKKPSLNPFINHIVY
jgi:hypothetical protein